MKSSMWLTAIKRVAYLAFWVILPLVLGVVLAVAWVPVPRVGVIRFEDVIWQETGSSLGELLDHVQSDRRIRAVVLEINSPGGEVTATEEVYYRLLELRQKKPLVVTVDGLAASGGYYMAAAADYIFAKPASLLGNIGVISFLPSADEWRYTDEDYVSTGPFKFSGGSRGDFVRQIELAKQGFLEAVYAQRGDKLQVGREVLAGGEIFMGVQAWRLGLVDELGANSEAVQKAASLAHVVHYRVEDVNQTVHGDLPQEEAGLSSDRLATLLASHSPTWRQNLYYLYVEPNGRTRP